VLGRFGEPPHLGELRGGMLAGGGNRTAYGGRQHIERLLSRGEEQLGAAQRWSDVEHCAQDVNGEPEQRRILGGERPSPVKVGTCHGALELVFLQV
jgi:hypothetical protein